MSSSFQRYAQERKPMTNDEWLTCTDLARMIRWVVQDYMGTGTGFTPNLAGPRKLRLIACAAWRVNRVLDPDLERSIHFAERVADGDRRVKTRGGHHTVLAHDPVDAFQCIINATHHTAEGYATTEQLCDTIREVLYNPFLHERPYTAPNPLITAMAETIYEGSCWEELPVLADAIEDGDAGFPNEQSKREVLAHLRSPGPHFKGCWALDRVLGYTNEI